LFRKLPLQLRLRQPRCTRGRACACGSVRLRPWPRLYLRPASAAAPVAAPMPAVAAGCTRGRAYACGSGACTRGRACGSGGCACACGGRAQRAAVPVVSDIVSMQALMAAIDPGFDTARTK